jgi:branched-chain amino acid transport system substrate-binding protein
MTVARHRRLPQAPAMGRNLALLFAGAAMASTAGAPARAGDITIGTAGPLTGPFAIFGAELQQGAAQAVADINAAGGLLGQQLVLETADDGCDANQATAVANQMTGKGIALMAGHFCSFASIPASAVYAQAKIVEISPASPHPRLTDERAGPGIFRVCGRSDDQPKIAGAFLARNFADRNIAFVDDKSAYGKGLADQARAAMNEAGKKEVLSETYDAGEKDFSPLVSKLNAARIDVLYIGGYHTDAAMIAREMRDQAMSTIVVTGDDALTEEYWRASGDAGEGTLVTFPPDPRRNAEAKTVVATFRKAGIEPEGYVLCSYAAVQVWAAAVEQAGSVDFDKVVAALNAGTFKSVLGDIKFNEKGDRTLPDYVFYVWHDGKYDYLKM